MPRSLLLFLFFNAFIDRDGSSLVVSWELACIVQSSLMKENNLLKMWLLTFCLQIVGTCHEKEQEIILRCSLTSCPESKATM